MVGSSDSATDRAELAWTFWCSCMVAITRCDRFLMILMEMLCRLFFFFFFFSHLIIEEDIFKPGYLCVCSQVRMQVMGRRKIYKCTEQPALNLIAKTEIVTYRLCWLEKQDACSLYIPIRIYILIAYSHIFIPIMFNRTTISLFFYLRCLLISRSQV